MKTDGILIVDANALSKRQVGLINRMALAFHAAGAFVIFVECVSPNPTISAQGRLKRMGYNFDDLVQIEQKHYEVYDFDVLKFINKTADNGSDDIVVVTGSGLVFQRTTEKGIGAVLHG